MALSRRAVQVFVPSRSPRRRGDSIRAFAPEVRQSLARGGASEASGTPGWQYHPISPEGAAVSPWSMTGVRPAGRRIFARPGGCGQDTR